MKCVTNFRRPRMMTWAPIHNATPRRRLYVDNSVLRAVLKQWRVEVRDVKGRLARRLFFCCCFDAEFRIAAAACSFLSLHHGPPLPVRLHTLDVAPLFTAARAPHNRSPAVRLADASPRWQGKKSGRAPTEGAVAVFLAYSTISAGWYLVGMAVALNGPMAALGTAAAIASVRGADAAHHGTPPPTRPPRGPAGRRIVGCLLADALGYDGPPCRNASFPTARGVFSGEPRGPLAVQ